MYNSQLSLEGKTLPRSGIFWNRATNNTFGHKNRSFAPILINYTFHVVAMNDYVSVRTVSWTHFHRGVSLCFVFLFNYLLVENIFFKRSSKIWFLYILSLYYPGRVFLVRPWLPPRIGASYPYVNIFLFFRKCRSPFILFCPSSWFWGMYEELLHRL